MKTTDAIGLVSLQIVSGTLSSGIFSSIGWGNAVHFIKLEADFTGGNTYVTLGTQELMSVPYAMYAAKTDTASLNLANRLAGKAPVNSPTFTGTVGGITKAMVVGLENVDNTADLSKPVSSATHAALDKKFNKADFPSPSSANEILYWNGTNWVSLSPGTTGKALTMSSTGLSWGCIVTNSVASPSTTPTLVAATLLTPSITIATTGATGIGSASGLPASVTAVWLADVITISGTPTAAGTFNYTIPLTGGCGTVSATGIITVNPAPCPATITYNSYAYNAVAIGTQCWMAENLRTDKYNDGTVIPDGIANFGWGSLTTGARAEYVDFDGPTNGYVGTYGYLYNWYAVNDYRKLCPSGWHVPTDTEWTTLTTFIGTDPGTKLKKNDALWSTTPGSDDYGFSALPGGYRDYDGWSYDIRGNAYFWSATEYDNSQAWYRLLYNSLGFVNRDINGKNVGASVRCLRD